VGFLAGEATQGELQGELHTYRVSLRSSFAYNSVNGCSMTVAVEFEK